MRELFVYYRVRAADAAALSTAARTLQAQLRTQHPALLARLLHRPDAQNGQQTFMETYATNPARAPDGVDPTMQAAIEAAAAASLQPLLVGPRRTEVFTVCDG